MKVCDVVRNSVWYDPRVKKQLVEYNRNNIDVVCIGLYDNKYDAKKIKCINIPIIIVQYPKKKRKIGFWGKFFRELHIVSLMKKEIIKTKAEIIHANDLNALVPAYLASKILHCPLIYDTHEIYLENLDISSNRILKLYWGVLEKRIIKKCSKIICVSHAAADYLVKKYKISAPMVITNCVTKSDYHSKVLESSIEVLNHGQFYEGRGYDIMLSCAALMKDYNNITFVLRGYGRIESQLKDYAKENNLTNVRFDIPVDVSELVKYASKSSIGLAITEDICLNFKLSVSNKIFEYASAGLPVIMSNIPEHLYLNNKYKFGIVIPDNKPETLKKAIIEISSSPSKYSFYSANSIKMSTDVNWENEFHNLISYEEDIINEY